MNPLIEKIQKARQSVVEIDGHKFTIRRPTDLEALEIQDAEDFKQSDMFKRFVENWDLQEIDIIPGGTPVDVAFDAELFMEYIADKADYWGELSDAITNAYTAHAESLQTAKKK